MCLRFKLGIHFSLSIHHFLRKIDITSSYICTIQYIQHILSTYRYRRIVGRTPDGTRELAHYHWMAHPIVAEHVSRVID